MCARLSASTVTDLCDELEFTPCTAAELAERLGTKHRISGKAISDPNKKVWVRQVLGQLTPATEVDTFVLALMERWLAGAGDAKIARSAMSAFAAS